MHTLTRFRSNFVNTASIRHRTADDEGGNAAGASGRGAPVWACRVSALISTARAVAKKYDEEQQICSLWKGPFPFMSQTPPGVLEVITGPMFSGKSEELIRRLKRARIARQRVACFKPDIDLRYDRTAIASHSQQTHEAAPVSSVEHLRGTLFPQLGEVEVVGIDEVQFLAPEIVPLAAELVALGKRVLLAGLDMTFTAEPFGPVPALMAMADKVTKLSAVCMVCGASAIHTQRLGQSQELVVVGATGMYEARCRAHFQPYADEHGFEQLELNEVLPALA